jgi:hypothetical protein
MVIARLVTTHRLIRSMIICRSSAASPMPCPTQKADPKRGRYLFRAMLLRQGIPYSISTADPHGDRVYGWRDDQMGLVLDWLDMQRR